MKSIVLIVSHQITDTLIEKYHRIRAAFAGYGDTVLLLNKEDGEEYAMPENVDCVTFSIDMLNGLCYEPIAETLVPGSNHFALLWFYLSYPGYRYYWNIEYDVEFTGDWKVFFDEFNTMSADFIATHLKWFKEDRYWYWWNSYQGVTLKVTPEQLIRSFNPIYRISSRALSFLDEFLKAGNSGHHEVLVPTALHHSGFRLLDFGGKGSFVLPGYEERFYLSNESTCPSLPFGTMIHKPDLGNPFAFHIADKLFHPVK